MDELNTPYVAERARGAGLAARLLTASIADRPAALRVSRELGALLRGGGRW